MRIDHIALWSLDPDRLKEFYERYFDGRPGVPYHNPRTGLRTWFLSFDGGARMEIMSRPDVRPTTDRADALVGIAHLSFGVGSRERVDALTAELSAAGYEVLSAPRTTGDGYYESCVADPDGNRVEITE